MQESYVYDKAKYHDDTIQQLGLPQQHAANHTVFFLRWLIERELVSDVFTEECGEILHKWRAGEATIHDVYEWWDCCLIDEMLSEQGNRFAREYFDFEKGKYLQDYVRTLQDGLPTEFHVSYSEQNYNKLRKAIDHRFDAWKKRANKRKSRWWPF